MPQIEGQSCRTVVLYDGCDRAPRRVCMATGYLSYGDARNRIPCKLVDISSSGAGIRFFDMITWGPRLNGLRTRKLALILPNDSRHVDCELIWKSGDRVGLRFHSQFKRL